METFLQQIQTLQWWIGVVIVGIIINLISGYFKKFLDDGLSLVSLKWKNKIIKKEELWNKSIEFLKNNPNELYLMILSELRLRIRALTFLTTSILLLLLAFQFKNQGNQILFIIYAIFCAIALCISLSDYGDARKRQKLLKELKGNNEINFIDMG